MYFSVAQNAITDENGFIECHHLEFNSDILIIRFCFCLFSLLRLSLFIHCTLRQPNKTSYRETRYFSGVLTGILFGFLIYLFLEPLFFPVGLNLAVVVLWVLAILSAFVGMSLGVLLPTLFPGLCFGVNVALLGGCFLNDHNVLYFPVAGGVLALAGAFLSVR